jgi:uncharacterized cupredoxin-like copper-binding protein
MTVGLVACASSKSANTASTTTGVRATVVTSIEPGAKPVAATVKEFAVSLDPATGKAGEVHFAITNQGTIEHEFVVFKSDLEPAALPLKPEGIVDEAGAGVTHIAEQEHVMPGTTAQFVVTLDAGKYVLLCNLPGHYKGGMRARFTVA